MLIEVVDPFQSMDYHRMGKRTFPVRVLPIGREKKLLRLNRLDQKEAEPLVPILVSELCTYYDPTLPMDWALDNLEEQEIIQFYLLHLEKMQYNDEVVKVVEQIRSKIDWTPIEEEARSESEKYLPAYIFHPVLLYLNVIEKPAITYLFRDITRGMLEIIKLDNSISNDRMRTSSMKIRSGVTPKEDKVSREMNEASGQSFDRFMAGLAEQGVDLDGF